MEAVTYLMVNQAGLWLVMFLPYGCYIPQKVSDGSIAYEMRVLNHGHDDLLNKLIFQHLGTYDIDKSQLILNLKSKKEISEIAKGLSIILI
ncbi:MAG: hypothetical protein WDA24_03405 [Tissierellales bacterium]